VQGTAGRDSKIRHTIIIDIPNGRNRTSKKRMMLIEILKKSTLLNLPYQIPQGLTFENF